MLAGFSTGDAELTVAFVRRFQSKVFGVALAVVGEAGAAEDVAQQAFERAWRHGHAYDQRRGSVAAWLSTITRNLAIDTMRVRRPLPVDPEALLARVGAGPTTPSTTPCSTSPPATSAPPCAGFRPSRPVPSSSPASSGCRRHRWPLARASRSGRPRRGSAPRCTTCGTCSSDQGPTMNEMTCEEFRQIGAELALGVADARERAGAFAHLEHCPGCRLELRQLSDVADGFGALAPAVEPPAGFESRLLARLEPERPSRSTAGAEHRRPLWAAAAAVAALAIGAVGWVIGEQTSPSPAVAAGHVVIAKLAADRQPVGQVVIETRPDPVDLDGGVHRARGHQGPVPAAHGRRTGHHRGLVLPLPWLRLLGRAHHLGRRVGARGGPGRR